MSQIDVWKAGGPSNSVMTGLEGGNAKSVSAKTLAKLDAALQWEPGSARRVYEDGGEPTELDGDGPSQSKPFFPGGTADRFVRDLKPGDMAQFSERISKTLAPATIQGEALRAAVDALLPKIDVSSFIPKGALDAVTAAALPASAVQNIMRAAENSASELLPDLIDVLSVEQRARLTYEILDILEEQGVDIEKLLDEEVNDVPDLGVTSDGQVWERDRHGNWAAVSTIKMESRGVIWVGRRSAFMPADTVTSRFGDITILDKKVLRDLLREAGSREIKPESIAAAALQSTSSVRDDLAARRDSNSRGRGAGKRTDEMTDEELADLADTDETWAGYVETRSETADEEI